MSVSCHHAHEAPPGEAEVKTGLAAAERRFVAAGQRWTPSRARALELLLRADGPVKAYDLIAVFDDGKATAPPTVYRALEALVAQGLAHRIASLNAFVACHHADPDHGATFLICDCCQGVEELAVSTAGLAMEMRERAGFLPGTVTIEAMGRCRRCTL